MPKDKQGSRIDIEERVEKAEEMLCAGVSPGRVERRLADEYGVTVRHARRYITRVYRRWQKQTDKDAPHRREKIIRQAERFYAKALAEKQFTAAANVLNLLARMSGAFTVRDPDREKLLAALGPPPDDPTLALVYTQKVMMFALREVIENPSIDPERRLRWIAEIGSKIGMTYPRVLIEHKLDTVEKKLDPAAEGPAEVTPVRALPRPATARGGARSADNE